MVLEEKTGAARKLMEEKGMGDLDKWLRSEHPVPKNQDGDCQLIEWMGLGHGSGMGDWKCLLRTETYGDLRHGGISENLDYLPCNNPDRTKCPIYLENFKE